MLWQRRTCPSLARGQAIAVSLRRLVLAGAALMSLLAVCSPASAQAAEPGVALPGPLGMRASEIRGLGTHWVRMFATWPDLEPQRGLYSASWETTYEQSFQSLPAGTKVLLDLVGSPQWETGSANEHTPPANPQEYAAFAGAIARRFSKWVSAYEIWNEEDNSGWFAGANPVAYTQLLQATYPAIKSADPSATVVLGGLTGNDYQYLENVYKAGGKGYFDAVGVHTDTACNLRSPYEFVREPNMRLIPDAFLAYQEVHQVMVDNGDDKPIWMTEMSWRTTNAECAEGLFAGQKAAGVTEAQQQTFLQQAYHCLTKAPYVQVALWFPLVDEGVVTSGLIHEDGSLKPSYLAMKAYAREGDKLHEECGDFSGPSITVGSPANNVRYSGPLAIRVAAQSSQGVFRIRLEIDGKLIRNYDGPAFPDLLTGAIDWQGAKHITYGRHTLTILAYTKDMNISRRSVTIFHLRPKGRHGHHHG
jgi:hypothetical protein